MSARTRKPLQHAEVTIEEVAKAAKVSAATVSRVLNGSAKVSRPKKRRCERQLLNLASPPTPPPAD